MDTKGQHFKLKNYLDYLNPRENISIIFHNNLRKADLHVHEFVELIFIAEGTCVEEIDGIQYDAEPGDLFFVNYGQTHAFEAKEGLQYYDLLYVPKYFSEELIHSESIYDIFAISIFREFMRDDCGEDEDETDGGEAGGGKADGKIAPGGPEESRSQAVHFRGNEFLYIRRLIEDMEQEFAAKETGYASILGGCSRVLFSKILRKLKAENTMKADDRCSNRIMAECLEYINERCFGKITLKEIAERAFYNPSYFSRIFHTYCGKSLSEYIKEKRIQEAGRLLKNTDLSLTEIMVTVGYTDKKQFFKCFKEIYHQTPSQFRQNRLP